MEDGGWTIEDGNAPHFGFGGFEGLKNAGRGIYNGFVCMNRTSLDGLSLLLQPDTLLVVHPVPFSNFVWISSFAPEQRIDQGRV